MFYRELHHFSRRALKGHYARAWSAAMLETLTRLGTALVPAVLSAVLIARGALTPSGLFFGTQWLWVLFTVLWSVFSFCVHIPVLCGTCSWFTHLVELEMPGQERCFFRTARAYCRGVYFFGTVSLLRWLAALPLAAACVLTGIAVRQSAGLTEGGLWLFAAVQGLTVIFWTGWLYIRFCVSLAAVPYLFLMNPKVGVLLAVRASRRMLFHRHRQLAALAVTYLPACLPVVTIPFLLPCLMTDMTLYLQLRIREYLQTQTEPARI
ncbi:MAG: hypothetical protein K2I93_07205 [Oscillospiraceae bacterium]|nr:hypothetical protein [Oscillospiraceae bacterium]